MAIIDFIILSVLVVVCMAVAGALIMLNDKVNKEARQNMARFVQNFNDMTRAFSQTDEQLKAFGKDRLADLRDEMDELLEYHSDLYDGIVDQAQEVRDKVERLLQGHL